MKFKLQGSQDFSWLKQSGHVSDVFDENDSGNISFGVVNEDKKYFVKYAGAQTMNYQGNVETAINNLIQAIAVYQEVVHPALIHYVRTIRCDTGVAAIFDWVEGDCLFAHWTFSKWNRYTCEQSPYYRFRTLSLKKKLACIDVLFDFMMTIETMDYVAIDFYDGSIIYDFDKDKTVICDIDFFQKKPVINHLGSEFWGSQRVKSPEENMMGASIDHISNVYSLGMIILRLLSDERNLGLATWCYSVSAYEVIKKATEEKRKLRYQSIADFAKAWKDIKR